MARGPVLWYAIAARRGGLEGRFARRARGFHTICIKRWIHMEYGLQMYSVRDITQDDLAGALDALHRGLGAERARTFHAHFSKIEYGKGGEVRHLTFADTEYGPEFAPLAALLAERGLAPHIICESAGTQAEDAQTMKSLYLNAVQSS